MTETAPDVAALAAALATLPLEASRYGRDADAEDIIAALAAQGWRIVPGDADRPDAARAGLPSRAFSGSSPDAGRITSAPEGHEQVSTRARGAVEATDDPVSAQAAPEQRLQAAWQTWLDERRRIEQAAVRAERERIIKWLTDGE